MQLGLLLMAGWRAEEAPSNPAPLKGLTADREGLQHRADMGSACSVVVADTLTDQGSERPLGCHTASTSASAVKLTGGGAHTSRDRPGYHVHCPALGVYTGSAQGTLVNMKRGRNTQGFWERGS